MISRAWPSTAMQKSLFFHILQYLMCMCSLQAPVCHRSLQEIVDSKFPAQQPFTSCT